MLHLWCQGAALFLALLFESLYCWYTYAVGIPMLDCWYTYAGPLVPECFTLLVPFFYLIYSQYFKFDLSPIHLPMIYIIRI